MSLQKVVDDPLSRWVFQPTAGHLLVVRNALFSLFYAAFGPRPAYWFAVVLATHLLNVALLFAVVRRLTGGARLACVGAAAWGISPTNAGSLGWYSVYGHVVVGTIVLVLLYRVARRLTDARPLLLREALGWCVLLLLGSCTFGVGIALVFPLVVFLLFPGHRAPTSVRALFLSFPLLILVIYGTAHLLYASVYGYGLGDSPVMLVALARNLRADALMFLHLLVVAATTVVAGFGYPLSSYPSAPAYAIGALVLGLGLAVIVASPSRTRRLLLALAVATAGCYGVIALGRAGLLDALHTPVYGAASLRYHYVGSIAVTVFVCVALAWFGEQVRLPSSAADALVVAWLIVAASLYRWSGSTIDHFVQDRENTERVVEAIRDAIDRTPAGEPVYIRNQWFP